MKRAKLSNKITKKLLLKIFNLETEMEKIQMKIRDFTFGFAKGKLLECERLPFRRQKDSF
jgi:hypothetical protein